MKRLRNFIQEIVETLLVCSLLIGQWQIKAKFKPKKLVKYIIPVAFLFMLIGFMSSSFDFRRWDHFAVVIFLTVAIVFIYFIYSMRNAK